MIIKHSFNYIINYKPLFIYKNFININSKNNIYCKNFFLFFLLLEFLKNNSKIKLKIMKKNFKSISFLRAPNKFKKSQVKLVLTRYKIEFYLEKFYFFDIKNNKILFYFINYLFYYYYFFESTLFFLEKKNINIKLDSKNLINFLLI